MPWNPSWVASSHKYIISLSGSLGPSQDIFPQPLQCWIIPMEGGKQKKFITQVLVLRPSACKIGDLVLDYGFFPKGKWIPIVSLYPAQDREKDKEEKCQEISQGSLHP